MTGDLINRIGPTEGKSTNGLQEMCRYNRPMRRLAWFTPTPPNRSGIAAYGEELLPLLASSYAIDVFTSPLVAGQHRPEGHPPVFEGHDFAWKHVLAPYDLVVYQLGNAT